MANRVGSRTAGDNISALMAKLKDYTSDTLNEDLWLGIINDKVAMIHALLSTKDKAIYKDRATLNTSFGQKSGGVPQGCSIATNVLTMPTYDAAVWSADITGYALINVGAIVIVRSQEGLAYPQTAYVTAVNATAKTLTLSANLGLTSSAIDVVVINTAMVGVADEILIANETWYKQVDQMIAVYDSGIATNCVDARTLENFQGMKKMHMSYMYKNSIVWVRDGEYLLFAKGSLVTAYGTRTLHYTRKPYPCTAVADIIDIPDENLDLLNKCCLLDGLQVLKVPIPQELKSAENQIIGLRKAKDEEIAKTLANTPD